MSEFHARLSPSGADRWMTCTASVEAEQGYEEKRSEFADEGTIAHALGETVLARVLLHFDTRTAHDYIGTEVEAPTARGTVKGIVTQEMADYVQMYVDHIVTDLVDEDKHQSGEQCVSIEERVYYDEYVKDGSGTADFLTIYKEDEQRVLHLVDLKYGKGVKVDAYQNRQGLLYALGAYQTYDWLHGFKDDDLVRIEIHQPRIGDGEPSLFETTIRELLEFADEAKKAAQQIELGQVDYKPTEKGCQFCKHKFDCTARAEDLINVIGLEFEDYGVDGDLKGIDQMNDQQISSILLRMKEIKAFLNNIEEHAMSKALAGESIPSMKLVEGRSLRKWKDENAAAEALEELIGVEKTYVEKLITPSQAEKILGKTKSEIKDLIVKPQGKPSLVHEDDKRPAFDPSASDADGFDDLDAA